MAEPSITKPLYGTNDVRLALSNAAALTVNYFGGHKGFNIPVSSGFFPLMFIANIWQRIQTYLSIPDSAPIEKMLAHPIVPLMGLISPTVGKISAIASLIGIARNSAPKLIASLKTAVQKPKEALPAAALHVFNLATQGYLTKNAYDAYDSLGQIEKKPMNTEDFYEGWKKNHETNSDWEEWFKQRHGDPFCHEDFMREARRQAKNWNEEFAKHSEKKQCLAMQEIKNDSTS